MDPRLARRVVVAQSSSSTRVLRGALSPLGKGAERPGGTWSGKVERSNAHSANGGFRRGALTPKGPLEKPGSKFGREALARLLP